MGFEPETPSIRIPCMSMAALTAQSSELQRAADVDKAATIRESLLECAARRQHILITADIISRIDIRHSEQFLEAGGK